ncbi:tetratricopeptide repeat protein [bacterium SCSIO 12741]|nr:tetratricopeptide repeat protein [bacterium SCSIO 12741]
MKEDFDPSFDERNNDDRLIKLEDMFADAAYYYFDVNEWEGIIEHYLSSLKLDKAVKALTFAQNQHPMNLELMLKEAEVLAENKKPAQAIALLKKLETSYPFDPELNMMQGSVYSRFGQHVKALAAYKQALSKMDDARSDVLLQMSSECQILDMPAQSLFWLKTLLKEEPENIEGLYELSLCFESLDRIQEGISFFQQFVEQNPYNHHIWFNLGNLYTANDQLEEALVSYDYSVLSYDEFSSGWYNKGTLLSKLDRYTEAIECYSRTLELEGPSAPTYCNMAECYENLEDSQNALDYYQKTLDHDESYLEAWIGAANIYLDLNNLENALNYSEKACKLDSSNPQANYIFAEVCQGLGFVEESRKAYKKVIQADSDNWEVYLDYSALLFEHDEKEEALFVIESGITLTGNKVELAYRAGTYCYLMGMKSKAFDHWNTAGMENPQAFIQVFDYCSELQNLLEVQEFFENF